MGELMNRKGVPAKPAAACQAGGPADLPARRIGPVVLAGVIAWRLSAIGSVWGEDPKPGSGAPPATAVSQTASSAASAQSPPAKLTRFAQRIIRQFDRNGDGRLQQDECHPPAADAIRQAWAAIDVNADEAVTVEELAKWLSGYARTHPFRVGSAVPDEDLSGSRTGRAGGSSLPESPGSVTAGANGVGGVPGGGAGPGPTAKFTVPKRRLPADLPRWFLERDADGDGQLTLLEFSPRTTPADVAAFRRYDLNGDGLLTPKEYLAATRPAPKIPPKKDAGSDAKSAGKTDAKTDAKADAKTEENADGKSDESKRRRSGRRSRATAESGGAKP
jgi:Ca2+-binding EF-hand superfamily protein